jgi:hypothetical protein
VTWLAADGPTVYDVVTAAVALAGLGVSAYSVRRQVKRETRSVKVACKYSFPVGAVSAVAPDEMVTVEVLNDGHRPVEISGVGFELGDRRQPLIMPLPLNGPVTFPRTLADGALASFYFDLAQLERAEAETGERVRSAFVDASGERYRGRFVKR